MAFGDIFLNKKKIIIIILITVSYVANAQNNALSKKVITAQAGTTILNSSSTTIQLDENVFSALNQLEKADYTVILTPIGNCGALRLKTKESKQFSVELLDPSLVNKKGSVEFNYVVFVTGYAKELNIKMATSIND